jgi:ribosome-binding factor A
MPKGYSRIQRVSDLIQNELAVILQREAENLGFGLVTVTGVDVSHDMSYAKIFISVLEDEKAKQSIKILNDAAKFIRFELASAVKLRVTPQLKFIYDDSSVRGNKITSLINSALKSDNSSDE